jgi:hypothetical protein
MNEQRTAKKFFNWTGEDFVGMWDSVEYKIEAGEKMMFPDYLADHFAKHLVDREMIKAGQVTGLNDELARKPMLEKCFTGDQVSASTDLEAEVKAMNIEIDTPAKAEEVLTELNPESTKIDDTVTGEKIEDKEAVSSEFAEVV